LYLSGIEFVEVIITTSDDDDFSVGNRYDVDEVLYSDDLVDFLKLNASETAHIHVLQGTNSDSGLTVEPPTFTGSEAFSMDTSVLFHTLATARVTKNSEELEAMRYAAYVASNAHVQVMRSTTVGMMEYELEARFRYEIYANGGSRFAAYTSICACGPNAAVLHYGHAGAPNERQLTIK
jgi:Xaa-Pro dipeptidase